MPRVLYPLLGSPLLTSCTVSACGACWARHALRLRQGVVCLICYVHCACIAHGKRQHGGSDSSGILSAALLRRSGAACFALCCICAVCPPVHNRFPQWS